MLAMDCDRYESEFNAGPGLGPGPEEYRGTGGLWAYICCGGGPGGLFYLVLDMVADLAGFVVVNAEAAAVIVPDLGDLAGLFEALDNIHFAHFHH